MIRPLHESDYTVAPDGTLKMTGLKPGERVHVILLRSGEDKPVVDPAKYRRAEFHIKQHRDINQPPLPWGSMAGSVFKYERPFDPACDPNDWEANR